jgi:hypothetical protein
LALLRDRPDEVSGVGDGEGVTLGKRFEAACESHRLFVAIFCRYLLFDVSLLLCVVFSLHYLQLCVVFPPVACSFSFVCCFSFRLLFRCGVA